jgi:small GTP-binding protein
MDNNEQSSKKGIIVPEKIKDSKNLNKNNNKKILKKKEKEKIKAKTSEMDIRVYKVVFIGPSGCGTKTALILRIADNHFHEQSIATVGVDFKLKRVKLENGEIIQLTLYDTVGQERFRTIAFQIISKADCIVLGFSVTEERDLLDIKNSFYPRVKEYPNVKLIYLIGNKIDVEDKERKVDKAEALNFRSICPRNLL